jgi:anaerobic magnesium-protoporphyrin IX monomethyl ester cyclase
MIKRILLIDADIFGDPNYVYFSHHPIGLLYLVSAAREVFPEIEFNVFHTSTSKDPIKKVESLIQSFKPDLVGLRALSTAKDPFKQVAEKVRELKPAIPIVGGGPFPSTCYEDILTTGLVDMVVIGEGETTFVELIGELMKSAAIPVNLKGTAVIEDGKVKLNMDRPLIQDVDAIPFPDYNFINLQDYRGIKNQALQEVSKCAFILATRGCPYDCFYCHQLFGRKIRRRSAENVVAEMKNHFDKRGIMDFVFLDDTFNVPMPEAKKVLRLIIEKLPDVRVNFPNGFRADHVDDEMIDLLEEAGTVEMALAIESAVPRLQKMMGKNLNIEKAAKAIDAASRRFVTRTLFIIGFPTETYDEAMQTINFAGSFEYVAQPMLSVLRIYNNSKIFNILKPTGEQCLAIAEQEKRVIHLEMFNDIEFYGDLFTREQVPLTSNDLKELLLYWMRNININRKRIQKSYQVIEKHFDKEKILEYYRNVFDKPKFNENDLQNLLKI